LLEAQEKWELDASYAESPTFIGDLWILVKTISKVLRMEGIHREEAHR
jgi:lipopolysaccharide/colanic/teichoic acid biosynthesis glycosyltransferase